MPQCETDSPPSFLYHHSDPFCCWKEDERFVFIYAGGVCSYWGLNCSPFETFIYIQIHTHPVHSPLLCPPHLVCLTDLYTDAWSLDGTLFFSSLHSSSCFIIQDPVHLREDHIHVVKEVIMSLRTLI